MERIFKHKESGEIAYFKDGLFKRSNIVIDLAELPSSEYWEEVNYKSEKTFPQANIIDTCLDPKISKQVEKEAEKLTLIDETLIYQQALVEFPEYDQYLQRIGFEAGANWMAERMYSEEDLKKAFSNGRLVSNYKGQWEETYSDENTYAVYRDFDEWFENFKK